MQWLESDNLLGVFMAPPCGTCSLARLIPLAPNNHGPPPLRSHEHPNGLVGLNFIERHRVSQANKLYDFVTKIALICVSRNIVVAIENPKNSLLWRTTFVQPLYEHLTFVAHQACAYGGARPKWTAVLHNHVLFNQLCKVCPGESTKHVHSSWGLATDGTFATKQEAFAIASIFAQIVLDQGWKPPDLQLAPQPSLAYT